MSSRGWVKSLYLQVLVAIVLGVGCGLVWPQAAVAMKPLADIFIKLIKMMIAPIVFTTVAGGIAKMSGLKQAGRVGLKALVYFEAVTTAALVIGLVVVNLTKPGRGMNVDPRSLETAALAPYTTAAAQPKTWVDILSGIVPESALNALAKGEMLQVLLVAVLFGLALAHLGEKANRVKHGLDDVAQVLFTVVGLVMRLAPLGALGAMAFTIGKYGMQSLSHLVYLMASVYATCFLFIALVLGPIAALCGFRLWRLLVFLKEEIILVLGTSSSEVALPRMFQKMQRLGCQRSVVAMVLPTGYSFNLDGTAIYLTMAAIFVAQALNVSLSIGEQLEILAVLLLTSKGAAAVTGGGFITLAATLATLGSKVPVEGLVLLLGVDRFMSEARAITNLIGNGVATMVVAKWERVLDRDQMRGALAKEKSSCTPAGEKGGGHYDVCESH